MDPRLEAFKRLLDTMDELRAKCPWDAKQTIQSIRNLTIEETYELADAISENDMPEIKKELGDLIMHVVFYSKIASESNAFDITDVLNGICDKLIFRHPHVFGDVNVANDTEVKQNWEDLKLKEGNRSVLAGVPVSLPALIKAYRMGEKARAAGFDWEIKEQVWDKVHEEIDEVKREIVNQTPHDKLEAEFGDLLFSVVNAARLYDIDPESALERTNRKFLSRFSYLENAVKSQGKSLKQMSLDEMDRLWNEAKLKEV